MGDYSLTQEDLHLIHNGRIWNSGCDDNSWMVFDQDSGYIRDVGQGVGPVTKFSQACRTDCGGRRVFPGFHEAHLHVTSLGLSLSKLNLVECKSIKDLQDCVREYIKTNPSKQWIIGIKWDQNRLGRMPTKEDVDEACADKPVVLFRDCNHIVVTNSKALEIGGLTGSSEAPEGGGIDKYPSGHPLEGQLTGVLREYMAFRIVLDHQVITFEEKKAAIRAGIDMCLSYGVTSAHSNDECMWAEFRDLAQENLLPIRVFHAAYWRGHTSGNFPAAGEKHGLLSCDRVKMFSDGSLGASTAALSENYLNTDHKGILIYSQEELNSSVKEATGQGFRLEMHAIGDAGTEAFLNALDYAGVAPQRRPLLTHGQILRPDLISRMKTGGVVANIQPQFVNTDGQWLSKLLPKKLEQCAYVWKTLLKEGVVCSGGSDAPIEEPRPMLGIYDSIFRRVGPRTPDNKNQFKPEEALTVQEAIDMYTIGGAYATLQDHRLGQLKPGFQADFVVMQDEEDPVSNPELFATAKVGEVWVVGKKRR